MHHNVNVGCNSSVGVQIGTTPDFQAASFVPAYACDDFTAQESGPTFAARVLLTNLTVGTTYYYVCGATGTTPWSQVFQFTFNSGASRPGGPVYAVLADFGFYNAESLEKLMAAAYAGEFDVLLHAGDFAYDLDTNKGEIGDGYMRQLQPIIAQLPYNGIPGNHESANNFTHYKMRFASIAENAGRLSGSGTNMFYSLNDGLTHFIFWDTEAFWTQPVDSQTAMINWLRADLDAANAARSQTPWIVALGHKGWWMDDTLNCPSGAGCVVWQILSEGGVDLYVTGHIHYYARDLPEYPCAANGTGVVDYNASSPNFGNDTNPVVTYTNPAYMTTIVSAAPGDQEVNLATAGGKGHVRGFPSVGAGQHSATSSNNYGFSYLTIANATHLHWRFETAVPHVNSSAPGYTDDLWLVVDSHGPRNNLPPV